MAPWVRRVFIHILPRLLAMRRPQCRIDEHGWVTRPCDHNFRLEPTWQRASSLSTSRDNDLSLSAVQEDVECYDFSCNAASTFSECVSVSVTLKNSSQSIIENIFLESNKNWTSWLAPKNSLLCPFNTSKDPLVANSSENQWVRWKHQRCEDQMAVAIGEIDCFSRRCCSVHFEDQKMHGQVAAVPH